MNEPNILNVAIIEAYIEVSMLRYTLVYKFTHF